MKAGTQYCRYCKATMVVGGILHEWWCIKPVVVTRGGGIAPRNSPPFLPQNHAFPLLGIAPKEFSGNALTEIVLET